LFTKHFGSLTRAFAAASVLLLSLTSAAALLTAASAQTGAETLSSKIKKLGVSPKKLSFGNLPPLMPGEPRVTIIHNPNSTAVDISSIESSNPEFVPSVNCVGSLAPEGECVVSVVFTPSSDGKKSGKLMIANSASGEPLSVGLKGEGKGSQVPTPTATPTATPTPAACPSPAAGACSPSGPPSISMLIPSSAVAGGPNIPLAVCGCNLTASTAVQWNGSGRATSFVSQNQVDASIARADIASVGVDQVTVSADSVTSAPETFFVGSTGGTGYAELEIDQQSNDLVNDPVNQVIYLSVPGAAPSNGNTISVIDLATGKISTSQFAGSEPDALAISDDSSYLYAGLDGAASVQRFTLPSLTTDISYPLGSNSFFGAYFPLDLQVAPGAPQTTAVSLGNMGVSPAAIGGIEIFDDSTPRPTIAKGFGPGGGGGVLYDSIQWGSDDTALYAANNEDTGFDFYTLSVALAGVTLEDDYPSDFSSFGARIHFDSGTALIYSDDGHVVNPSTGNPVGEYSATIDSVMVPDSTINRVFFVSSSGAIQSFNQNEFSLVGSITIPGVSSSPLRIIRFGNNGIAFNTSEGPVYLIGGNFVH
jgi:hypothetical protein